MKTSDKILYKILNKTLENTLNKFSEKILDKAELVEPKHSHYDPTRLLHLNMNIQMASEQLLVV